MSSFMRSKTVKCGLPVATALVAALIFVPVAPAMANDVTETENTTNTEAGTVVGTTDTSSTQEVTNTDAESSKGSSDTETPTTPTSKVAAESIPEVTTLSISVPVPDTTKPVVSLTSGPTGSFNSAGASLVIGASDEVGLVKVVANIYSGATLIQPNQAAASGTSGSLTVDLSGLTNGTYTVKYNALDTSGNVASTGLLTLTVDNTKPTITLKTGSTFVNGFTTVASFKLFDAGKIDYVTVNGVIKDLSNNVYSDLNAVKPGQFGAVEGLNTIVAYDTAGNASAPYTLYLDTTGPTATVKTGTSTIEGSVGSENVFQFVSYKLHDQANVDKLFVNGVEKNLTDDPWSDLNALKPGQFGAVEGLNTIVLVDGLGNQTTFTVTLDTTKPILSLPSGEVISGTHTFSISQIEANPNRAYVEFMQLVDGKWKKLVGYELKDTNTLDFAVDTTLYAEDGTYQIKVSTWDLAGNHASATSGGFVIDNSGPEITVKTDESITADGGYEELWLKLHDLNGVDKVEINGVEKDLTDDEWSDVNGLRPGVFGAVEGENVLVAYDIEGNSTEFRFTIVVPVPVIDDPDDETPDGETPDDTVITPTNGTPSVVDLSKSTQAVSKSNKNVLASTGVDPAVPVGFAVSLMVLGGLLLRRRRNGNA